MMKTRPTLATRLVGKLHRLLEDVRTFLGAPARSARQPVLIPIRAERRLRPGHRPGSYRHYE